jgi:hypothetical protein
MLRMAAGVVAGLLVWAVVATLGNLVLRAALPGYSQVEAAMNFTLVMMLSRLVLGVVSSFCAGFATAWIAKRRSAAAIVAGIMLVVFLPVHYRLWDTFPAWYHGVFLLSLLIAPVVGAMCYLRWNGSSADELPTR